MSRIEEQELTPLVTSESFRNIAGYFASGITVITTMDGEAPAGTTVSAVSSLSLDPPLMLVCLNKSSSTHDKVLASGKFAINILAQDQGATAYAFARKGDDKFAGIPWHPSASEQPLIDNSLASIVCNVADTAVGGTHTVFMGQVVEAETHPGEPLTYYRGEFGRFDPEAESKGYAKLRELVLSREIPVSTAVDIEMLAAELRIRPEYLSKAVIRLETEGWLERSSDGSAVVRPVSLDMARGAFAAQCSIELGVVAVALQQANDVQVSVVAEATKNLERGTQSKLAERLNDIRQFHQAILSLSASPQLQRAFEQMSTTALWRHVLSDAESLEMLDPVHLVELGHAVQHRDLVTAENALREQLERVIQVAESALERGNGEI